MKTKIICIDFDGTIMKTDVFDELCDLAGKKAESIQINADFHAGKYPGVSGLIARINFLSGMSVEQIENKLSDYLGDLMPGVREFFDFCRTNNIITVIASGNIVPVIDYFKKELGADYTVGVQPQMKGNTIDKIEESDIAGSEFKVVGIKKILEKHGFDNSQMVAIGDSIGDQPMFEFANKSITINPKGEIEKFAEHTIYDDLSLAIPYID